MSGGRWNRSPSFTQATTSVGVSDKRWQSTFKLGKLVCTQGCPSRHFTYKDGQWWCDKGHEAKDS